MGLRLLCVVAVGGEEGVISSVLFSAYELGEVVAEEEELFWVVEERGIVFWLVLLVDHVV